MTDQLQPGQRLILAWEPLLDALVTRTYDGRKLTAEWGEPDERGWYSPTFTATDDGIELVERAELERLRWIEALARKREHAEEVYADAETAYNASHSPTLDRAVLQVDRLATERAEAILALRDAFAIPPAALRQPSDTERQP